ncbi:MAG: divergent polysaccharide deacetylase family protein [Desulfosarcinaceae bacterium]|nr:divergent polysaccharide deacetylase family protein [Desulfosarcinaceae bacterium]
MGLAILVMLVVSAAAMAHHLLLRAPYGRLAKPIPPAAPPHASESRPTASAVRHKVPAYEIFDQHTPPEPEATPQPPVPSDGKRRPLVAIIIDDLGYDYQLAAHFLELDGPFTFSMLPRGPFTRKIIAEAHAKGNEIMLHLPMEPMEYPEVSPGPGALLAGMTPDELLAQLDADLAAIPHVKGVNNHMGSRLSTLAPQMRQIFSRLKARGLYYIDSRTTKETVGRPAAERLQLNFAERDIFIDHFQDADFIRQQLRRLIQRAYAQGYAIGIAHPHPLTIELIKAGLPDLKKQVSLVPVSAVVQVAG